MKCSCNIVRPHLLEFEKKNFKKFFFSFFSSNGTKWSWTFWQRIVTKDVCEYDAILLVAQTGKHGNNMKGQKLWYYARKIQWRKTVLILGLQTVVYLVNHHCFYRYDCLACLTVRAHPKCDRVFDLILRVTAPVQREE